VSKFPYLALTVTLLLLASAGSSAVAHPATSSDQQSADEPNTVGEISEEVADVRFKKLGYQSIAPWKRNGDYWETTATKDGKRWQLRLHVLTGDREEELLPTAH
jgi:hypothetical protein